MVVATNWPTLKSILLAIHKSLIFLHKLPHKFFLPCTTLCQFLHWTLTFYAITVMNVSSFLLSTRQWYWLCPTKIPSYPQTCLLFSCFMLSPWFVSCHDGVSFNHPHKFSSIHATMLLISCCLNTANYQIHNTLWRSTLMIPTSILPKQWPTKSTSCWLALSVNKASIEMDV